MVLTREKPVFENSPRSKGKVLAAGITVDALVEIQGVNRRWDWNGGKDAMIIEPDGRGIYVNFRMVDEDGKSRALSFFDCHRR